MHLLVLFIFHNMTSLHTPSLREMIFPLVSLIFFQLEANPEAQTSMCKLALLVHAHMGSVEDYFCEMGWSNFKLIAV